ncbi:MAG: hypothetical protein RMJ98_12090, partial [Myxococcales bacterium]|nr:hypothetical protein [Polyangiaceae bacterium]MDW8250027.1 hypothetical protein [Myxococcales bacterium]
MFIDPKDALRSAVRYLHQNPDVMKKVVHNVRDYKITIPLDVLRYLAKKAEGKKNAPKDVTVEAAAPALRVGGRVTFMGTALRFSVTILIDDVSVTKEELRFQVRLSGVNLDVEGDGASPVVALIKSGMLDLSKPGNIVRYLPNRPPFLLEAEEDRIVLDLMREEKITKNPRVMKVFSILVPVFGLRRVAVEGDVL